MLHSLIYRTRDFLNLLTTKISIIVASVVKDHTYTLQACNPTGYTLIYLLKFNLRHRKIPEACKYFYVPKTRETYI